jgi:hypothetical protein
MRASSFNAIAAVQIFAVAGLLWFLLNQSGPWDLQRCLGTALLLVGIGGVAVARTGFVLVFHRPVLWLLVAAIIVMQTVRARREARVLEAAFGDAYRDYRRKTWF